MDKLLSPLLAATAVLLLGCLLPMPYGYFQLVRITAVTVFILAALHHYRRRQAVAAIVFVALAVLFQPFTKLGIGRTLWNVLDVVVAAGLTAVIVRSWLSRDRSQPAFQPFSLPHSLRLPLGPDEALLVVPGSDSATRRLIASRPDIIDEWSAQLGLRIVYLPLLLQRIRQQREAVIAYRMPHLSHDEQTRAGTAFIDALEELQRTTDAAAPRTGIVCSTDTAGSPVDLHFHPIDTLGSPIGPQLLSIGQRIAGGGGSLPPHSGEGADGGDDDDIAHILDEIRERVLLLRQRGVAERVLQELLKPDDRLSRVVVSSSGLLLPDYNNMEIHLEPLTLTVYILFLRHEEGIAFKQLADYRDELIDIYAQLRGGEVSPRERDSIERLVNPLSNSINEKCTRIRSAFLACFDDYMARNYYITGRRGEKKTIALPRELVDVSIP